jgi:DNA-binding transcriptional ArsR family regulator
MTYESAIAALADPTRRTIIDALRAGPCPVGKLADALPISRPAVSQHLKILTDAGLLVVETQGTRRHYALAPDGISALRNYLDTLWTDALGAFAAEAQRQANMKGQLDVD